MFSSADIFPSPPPSYLDTCTALIKISLTIVKAIVVPIKRFPVTLIHLPTSNRTSRIPMNIFQVALYSNLNRNSLQNNRSTLKTLFCDDHLFVRNNQLAKTANGEKRESNVEKTLVCHPIDFIQSPRKSLHAYLHRVHFAWLHSVLYLFRFSRFLRSLQPIFKSLYLFVFACGQMQQTLSMFIQDALKSMINL